MSMAPSSSTSILVMPGFAFSSSSSRFCVFWCSCSRRRLCATSFLCCRPCRMVICSSFGWQGFNRKRYTSPSLMARTAASRSAWPERIMRMVLGHCFRTSERNWLPVMPGMRSSDTTTSMSLPARIIRPFCAESAVKISNCVRSRLRTSAEVRFGSSSTRSSLLFSMFVTLLIQYLDGNSNGFADADSTRNGTQPLEYRRRDFGATWHQPYAAGAHDVRVDHHSNLEVAQSHFAAHHQSAIVGQRLGHGLRDRRGQAGCGLGHQLRGLFGNTALRDMAIELHRRPQDGGANLLRLPG